MSAPTPEEYAAMEDRDDESMMELWVSRAALETVVQAASQRLSELIFPDTICKLEDALGLIHKAIADAFEDPLDMTPL